MASGDSGDVEALVEECFERLLEHGEGAVDEFCAEHPQHAVAIRGALRQLTRMGLVEPPGEPQSLGEFRLLRRLGRGGMGVVHLAEQPRLHRRVALKLMRPGFHADGRSRERFRREVETLARLDHPNLCTVYEAGDIDGVPYLAMRYVEGESLARRLDRLRAGSAGTQASAEGAGASAVKAAAHQIEKVARALHTAHELGLVHRDVKPANILLDQAGEPVLIDFGLARDEHASGTLTATGDHIGTPAYMAPEQIRQDRHDVDRRTDVHALGVTLYECLTLRRPFAAATRESLYRQILSDPPPDPRRLNRHVPLELALILGKALQKDPALRFASALELAEELRRFREHHPIHTRRARAGVRTWRWVQRNPTPTGILAATMLGLVASLWFLGQSQASALQLRALAMLARADELEGNPELGLQIVREALRIDDDPAIIARTQLLAFALREHDVLEPVAARRTRALWSPDGRHLLIAGQNTPAMLFRRDGTVKSRDLPATPVQFPAAAFAPDGSELALADDRAQVRRYHLGEDAISELVALDTKRTLVTRIEYSPDSRRLLVVDPDQAALWSRDGTHVTLPRGPGQLWHTGAILADGRILACGRLWDRDGSGGRELANQDARPRSPVIHIGVAADRFFTLSNRGALRVYGTDGALTWQHEFEVQDARYRPSHAEFDSAGEGLVVGFQDGRIAVLGVLGRSLHSSWHVRDSRTVTCVRFTPDNKRIVAAVWSGAIEVFNLFGEPVDELVGHQGGVTWLAFEPANRPVTAVPCGTRLASTSALGEARLWSLEPRAGVPVHIGHGWAGLAVSADGTRVVFTSENGTLHLLDASGRHLARKEWDGAWSFVSIAPDGSHAIVSDMENRILRWDLRQPDRAERLPTTPFRLKGIPPSSLPDGRLLTVDDNGDVWTWRPDEPAKLLWKSSHGNSTTAVHVARDGDKVLIGTWKGDVHIVDRSGTQHWRAPQAVGLVNSITFSPDEGEVLVAADGPWAWRWNLRTGSKTRLGPHEHSVVQAVYSTDGGRIATVARDGALRVFDAGGGALRFQVVADRTRQLRCVAFTSTGQVVTAGGDGSVRWWWIDREPLLRGLETLGLPELTEAQRGRFQALFRR